VECRPRIERKVDTMNRWIGLSMVVLLVMVSGSALAVGPGGSPGSVPSSGNARMLANTGFAGTSETAIDGVVMDRDGQPLSGVTVKLYVGGVLLAEKVTAPDGTYEFVELLDYGQDVTVSMWFVPADQSLVMENVLLKESTGAVAARLYSDCTQRLRLDPLLYVPVRLYTLEDRTRSLRERGCVK
jgi:hypothetical protein